MRRKVMNVVTKGRDEAGQRETKNRYEKKCSLGGRRQIMKMKLKVRRTASFDKHLLFPFLTVKSE
jgi:hypothetical protein